MSTVDNILFSVVLFFCFNDNEFLSCAFIDFTEAFDYVVEDVIWYKL